MPMDKKRYPADWQEIAKAVKEAAGWMCEECGKQCYRPGEKCENRQNVLTVHHKDHVPENCDPSNLIALCAPCHLKADKEHHAATRRYNAERRRAAKKLRRCIEAQETPKDGHSGHENDQCGEIMAADESRLSMAYPIECDLSTRGGFIEAIKSAGRYIEDHAENILGEYPSLLTDLTITANFRFDEVPTVEVKRGHIVCDAASYPQNSANVDTLEQVAIDLYAWIDGVLNKNWCMELPADLDRYKERFAALGVAL